METSIPDNLPDNLNRLRQMCMELNIGYGGTKAQLKAKLRKRGIYGPVQKESKQFAEMKVPELVVECKSRGLTHSKYSIAKL